MAQSLTSRLSRLAISNSNKRSIFTSSAAATKLKPSPIILSSVRNQFNCGSNNGLFHSNNAQQQLSSFRCLSSMIQARTIDITTNNNNASIDHGATSTLSPLLSKSDAENFAAFVHANRHQKVKPFILKRRRQNLKTYIGNEKNIRHSPWRMNLVCQFAHGLTVPEALKQLMFCQKVKAPLVAKVIRRTANLADIRDGIQPSQLEVAECFTTHGTHLKRLKIMGRGR